MTTPMIAKKRQKNSKKNFALKFLDSFSESFKYISSSNFFNSKILNYWLQWSNGYDLGLWILGSGFDSRLWPCPIPIGHTGK